MRFVLAAFTLLALTTLTQSVSATSNVSAKYDGVYSGHAFSNPDMSAAANCAPFEVAQVRITQGILHSPKAPEQPDIRGFITEEGYVSGFMTRPGGQRYPLDGRLEGEEISAGFIDEAAQCAWIVELTLQEKK